MKKKFVSFLILACAIVSIGLVGSCKDYADDMVRDLELSQDKETRDFKDSLKAIRTTIKNNYNDLQSKINKLDSRYKADSIKVRNELAALAGKEKADSLAIVTALNAKINTLEAAHKADTNLLWTAIRNLDAANKTLEEALEQSNDSIDEVKDTLAALINRFNQKVAAASANVKATADSAWALADSIRGAIVGWDDKISDAYTNANYALALAQKDSIRIDALEDTLGNFATIDTVLAIAQKNLAEAKGYTDALADSLGDVLKAMTKEYKKMIKDAKKELKDLIEEKLQPIRDFLTELEKKVNKNIEDIAALTDRVDSLEKKIKDVEKLMNAEEKRITSLLVQGVKTPAFGSFSLPIGIRSNILLAYYGEFGGAIEFPTTATANFVGNVADQFSEDEASTLRFSKIVQNYESGVIVDTAANNAGKLYLTVNPNNVALDDSYTFTLVNSNGTESKAVLGNLRPSTDKLTFGYTRATVDAADTENGFYEADVKINAEDVDALKPSIDVEDLKTIAKTAKNEKSLSSVTKSVLNSLDGLLDANAIQVTWTDSLGDHKVKSGYDLAVAAVKPLSFHTSLGAISSRIPSDPIGDLLASLNVSSIDLDITPITLSTGTLNFTAVSYSPAGAPTIHFALTDGVGTPLLDLNGNPIEGDIDYSQVRNEMTALVNDLNGKMDDFNDEIDGVITEIQTKVNNLIAEIEGKVKDEVDDMVDGIVDQIGSNGMVKRINSLLGRLKGGIDNLFDITLLYKGADDAIHSLSSNAAIPTLFDGVGDFDVYLTSYNADILAPAFKKYIAVVNVFKTDDPTISAKGGNTVAKSVMNNTNSNSKGFVKVLDGSESTVTFHPQIIGYTYEIVYSALDYHGKISTRRFFVTVK
ncbi:MAG: hypothetical protein IKS24_09885 [Bacteroidaceae bacterium]|nr:hypothetical protein [Bacteroidaceae bacterium]